MCDTGAWPVAECEDVLRHLSFLPATDHVWRHAAPRLASSNQWINSDVLDLVAIMLNSEIRETPLRGVAFVLSPGVSGYSAKKLAERFSRWIVRRVFQKDATLYIPWHLDSHWITVVFDIALGIISTTLLPSAKRKMGKVSAAIDRATGRPVRMWKFDSKSIAAKSRKTTILAASLRLLPLRIRYSQTALLAVRLSGPSTSTLDRPPSAKLWRPTPASLDHPFTPFSRSVPAKLERPPPPFSSLSSATPDRPTASLERLTPVKVERPPPPFGAAAAVALDRTPTPFGRPRRCGSSDRHRRWMHTPASLDRPTPFGRAASVKTNPRRSAAPPRRRSTAYPRRSGGPRGAAPATATALDAYAPHTRPPTHAVRRAVGKTTAAASSTPRRRSPPSTPSGGRAGAAPATATAVGMQDALLNIEAPPAPFREPAIKTRQFS
ncbi:uncharacterized protein BXZ73DRAFT_79821 [Epithele typhae]|uniref:uncharacterized protein n=1 Tax=Epithele typhae TaxID=378194 RepID=UPI002007A0FE|nr:uncharacterized protein BXZ73DRAFT_79821 [Epithele typhae]KAH9921672.1 hypothetical protein BXZ73DRAFT_79821 [Epithele typhae]